MIFNSEDDLVNSLVHYLNNWFICRKEIWSDCGKGRIDVVAECRQTKAKFGIECKLNNKKRGEEIGEHIRQAIRYSQMKFDGIQLPIFIAPQISSSYLAIVDERTTIKEIEWIKDRHQPHHEHHTANGLLGDFNVGELRTIKSKDPYRAFMFSNKVIYNMKPLWSDKTKIAGLHEQNYKQLLIKIKEWKL